MPEPHPHEHSHPHSHGHVHSHVHAGPGAADSPPEPRPSWLLHSVAQRLFAALLVCAAVFAAMLWATSAQG